MMHDMRVALTPPPPLSARRPPPVLRWLEDWSDAPTSPSSCAPSPALVSLTEALREPLVRPPLAHLRRRPPLYGNLTRSTLPTASLYYSSAYPYALPSYVSTQSLSPPSISAVSSLDTLKSLSAQQYRSISNSISSPNWWNFVGTSQQIPPPPPRRKKYRSPKNPIIFCHGLLGFDSVTIGPSVAPVQVSHWRGIREALEDNGTKVLITRVPATSSPADRAKVLEQQISRVYPGQSVHLIGHSMGGIDCRYLATHLTTRKFSVLSVTTIATPHRGSFFADHFLSTFGPERLPSVLSLLDLLPNGGGDGKAFESLTIANMAKFNEETPDVDGVRYFSCGAVYNPGLIDTWKYSHSVVYEKEGANDGLVSESSARWGTYLGTLQDVNHLDLVGWINTARYKWAEMRGREIEFRPASFYLGIADMLAGEVEGIPKEGEDGPFVRHRDEDVREALSDMLEEGHDSQSDADAKDECYRQSTRNQVEPSSFLRCDLERV